MAGWGPFLAVAVLLTVAVLGFARASQPVVRESAEGDTADAGPSESPRETRETDPREPLTEGTTATGSSVTGGRATERNRTEDRTDNADSLPTEDIADHLAGNTASGAGSRSPRPGGVRDVELSTGALLANVAFTQGIVAAAVAGAAWYFTIPATAFGLSGGTVGTPGVATVAGVGFGVVLWAGNELSTRAADAVGAAYDESVRRLLAPGSVGGWVVLFGGVLPLVALSEELLFRAALVGVPAAGYGVSPWLLAVLSSLAFALGHGAQGRVGIVVTGTLGLVLAGGYVLSGSLLLVVVAHYVINALEFLVHELLAGPR